MSVPATDRVAMMTELARRFAAGDSAGAAVIFHPRIRIQQPESLPHGGWHEGQAGLAEMGAAFGKHWTRAISDPRIIDGGDTVVQVTTQTWTAKVTGRSATVDVVELFRFRDDLVAEIRVFQQDTATLLATLER
jgi:ketosteroid isomerase-like protein